MSAKTRYDAARTSFVAGNGLHEIQVWDCFEYIEELERALAQEGHIVEFDEDGFGLEHPVGCRKDGLLNCDVWAAIDDLPDTPVGYGRFNVDLDDNDELVFEVQAGTETIGVKQ